LYINQFRELLVGKLKLSMESVTHEVVIGQKIKEVFESSGIKVGDFADKLGMVRQNVYRIFERTHIDTGLLIRISQLLEHDFFQYYTNATEQEIPISGNTASADSSASRSEEEYALLATELSKTKAELEQANKEIMYLKKIIDLMEERAKWLSEK
jgi:transcriptional regulator with XRE-family HTH domain